MAASAADLSAFRQIQKDVLSLAYRDLLAYWNGLDLADPVAAVRALEAFLPDLVQAYGEVAAAAAADFYDSLRETSPAARKAFTAVMGDAVRIEQIQASTRWAVGPMFGRGKIQTPEQALSNVVSITDRFVKAQSRSTIVTNVERDPARARFARVPSGATTCAFCLMLASRGPVYASDNAAAHEYHGHCDCVPTPIWDGDPLPEGYDLNHLRSVYKSGVKEADSASAKGSDGVLAAIRKQQGIA